MKKLKRLSVVTKNPIIYQAPLYKEYALAGNDIEVLYLDKMGVTELIDAEFKIAITWDIPLLDGYHYTFLKNYSKQRYGGFWARINPGLILAISKRSCEAVLITGYDTFSCWLALIVAKTKGIPVIWRGEATLRQFEKRSLLKEKLKKTILTYFFRSCSAVMFSCTGNKEYLKYYGVSESKLFPIPCAVDNDYFRGERDKYVGKEPEIRHELGIDPEDLVVLFLARFTTRKRPMDLLEAIRRLKNKDVTILFVGDGIERNRMEDYAIRHNIKAVFSGFQNQGEIAKFYTVADIATVISDYDPSPKAMNEAMNFRLPIIVTDVVGTAKDLVEHGENGFVVKVGDTDAIAEYISYFCDERNEVGRMGENSLEIVSGWNFKEDARWIEKAVEFVIRDKKSVMKS